MHLNSRKTRLSCPHSFWGHDTESHSVFYQEGTYINCDAVKCAAADNSFQNVLFLVSFFQFPTSSPSNLRESLMTSFFPERKRLNIHGTLLLKSIRVHFPLRSDETISNALNVGIRCYRWASCRRNRWEWNSCISI